MFLTSNETHVQGVADPNKIREWSANPARGVVQTPRFRRIRNPEPPRITGDFMVLGSAHPEESSTLYKHYIEFAIALDMKTLGVACDATCLEWHVVLFNYTLGDWFVCKESIQTPWMMLYGVTAEWSSDYNITGNLAVDRIANHMRNHHLLCFNRTAGRAIQADPARVIMDIRLLHGVIFSGDMARHHTTVLRLQKHKMSLIAALQALAQSVTEAADVIRRLQAMGFQVDEDSEDETSTWASSTEVSHRTVRRALEESLLGRDMQSVVESVRSSMDVAGTVNARALDTDLIARQGSMASLVREIHELRLSRHRMFIE